MNQIQLDKMDMNKRDSFFPEGLETPVFVKQKRLLDPKKLQRMQSFMQSNKFSMVFDEILDQINSQKKKIQVDMNLQHVSKQEFFKICKQFIVGGSVNDPSVTFLKNCNTQFVAPCPVFVRIQNCVLNLIGYRLNIGHA